MTTLTRAALFAIAAAALTSSAAAQDLSTSVLRPTKVDPASGRIAGAFPGGDGATSYYVAVDLQPGELMTQLEVSGRPNAPKRVELELLDANGRVSSSSYVMAESEAKRDVTKSHAIDTAGR